MPDLRLALHRPSGRPPTAASPPSGPQAARPAWLPVWSVPAAMRAARAVVVIPSLFALAYEGFGNLQMALFAAFGGFASLIFAAFGGTKRDVVHGVAHQGEDGRNHRQANFLTGQGKGAYGNQRVVEASNNGGYAVNQLEAEPEVDQHAQHGVKGGQGSLALELAAHGGPPT